MGVEPNGASIGRAPDHFYVSTISFTVIIHIIIYKLFLETTFWNPITLLTCLCCFALYYVLILIGNVNAFSSFFQPQLANQVFLMLSTGKFWIILVVLPIFALVPDITWTLFLKVLKPNVVDQVMLKGKEVQKVALN